MGFKVIRDELERRKRIGEFDLEDAEIEKNLDNMGDGPVEQITKIFPKADIYEYTSHVEVNLEEGEALSNRKIYELYANEFVIMHVQMTPRFRVGMRIVPFKQQEIYYKAQYKFERRRREMNSEIENKKPMCRLKRPGGYEIGKILSQLDTNVVCDVREVGKAFHVTMECRHFTPRFVGLLKRDAFRIYHYSVKKHLITLEIMKMSGYEFAETFGIGYLDTTAMSALNATNKYVSMNK